MKAGLKRIAIIPDGWIFVVSTRDEADLDLLMALDLTEVRETLKPERVGL